MSHAFPPDSRPSSHPARLKDVDSLRGFALLGILVVNSAVFASPYFATGLTDPAFSGLWDDAARFVSAALFESKFYLLFSFLFGYSFTLQLTSAQRAGRPHRPEFLRRLTLLLGLGIAHACLLYPGDILTLYALIGLLLIPLQRLSPRRCLTLSAALILMFSGAIVALGLLESQTGAPAVDPQETATTVARALTQYRQGLLSTIRFNVEEWTGTIWLLLMLYQGPQALAMFLLGLAAGKSKLLDAGGLPEQTLWRIVKICGPIGLAGGVALALSQNSATDSGIDTLIAGVANLTAPLLTATYGAALLLVLRYARAGWLTQSMAAAGRMALSNYLLQSVICSVVFTGYGFALSGSVSPPQTLLFAFLVYSAQLAASVAWLRRYQQGPAECLLRAFTHWQAPRLTRITPRGPAG